MVMGSVVCGIMAIKFNLVLIRPKHSFRHMKNTVNVVTCGAQEVSVRNSCSLFNVPAGLLVSSPTSFLLPPLQH